MIGNVAIPVTVIEDGPIQGGAAISVYGYSEHPDGAVMGGPAVPVMVITDSDLIENGGRFYLEGSTPISVYTAPTGTPLIGGPSLVVYAVNPDDWPNPSSGSFLLLESGDFLLLETGDKILLEQQ